MGSQAFRAAGFSWRLFSGPQAIENNLAALVDRAGAKRAFLICSPSIKAKTDTGARIEAALGDRHAGTFDGIENDSTYSSVKAATDAARAAGADLLIAAGGGSVIVAVRAVAVFLGEDGDPFELMTQYPAGKPAFSPRLMAPKPPIINIPTTPTSAMNRAGTGLKNPDLDQRMEYFDPKTRPQGIVLDDDALMATPAGLLKSTATTLFSSTLGPMSETGLNPLAEADRDQAFRLAARNYRRLATGDVDAAGRVEMCLAAFLQNRAEDDGRLRHAANAFSGDYATSTALHLRYPRIGQGEATSVVHATAIRMGGPYELASARQVAAALGAWREGMEAAEAAGAAADALEEVYRAAGAPTRFRDLDIPEDDLIEIAKLTVKNFNANRGARSGDDQIAASLKLMQAAW